MSYVTKKKELRKKKREPRLEIRSNNYSRRESTLDKIFEILLDFLCLLSNCDGDKSSYQNSFKSSSS